MPASLREVIQLTVFLSSFLPKIHISLNRIFVFNRNLKTPLSRSDNRSQCFSPVHACFRRNWMLETSSLRLSTYLPCANKMNYNLPGRNHSLAMRLKCNLLYLSSKIYEDTLPRSFFHTLSTRTRFKTNLTVVCVPEFKQKWRCVM